MKQSKETVYRCEYCNKSMLNKGAMSLHERMCSRNPKNRHKCFKYCKSLNKDEDDANGFGFFSCGNDQCALSGVDLYSYKLERFHAGLERIKEEGLTRMPLDCDFYEIEEGHDSDFIELLNKE